MTFKHWFIICYAIDSIYMLIGFLLKDIHMEALGGFLGIMMLIAYILEVRQ